MLAPCFQSCPLIKLTDITLRHGPEPLLEGASATVFPGHKVGLIGANGSGKTSLFGLLLGKMSVDAGEVSLPSDWTIAHMAQEIEALDRPALEFVIDGDRRLRSAEQALRQAETADDGEAIARAHTAVDDAGGYSAKARAAGLLDGLGFAGSDHQRPVVDFSGGWRIRLSLAQALMCPSDLLLLDEPTNHLDLETVMWLEDWLRRYAGTLILISHDRDFIDNVVESVIHIENHRLVEYSGGYSGFERQRAERLALEQAAFEKQQRQIAHMRKFIDRFRAKASKARAAQSRIKALERMEALSPAHADSPFDFAFRPPPRAANPLLALHDVRLGYGPVTVLDGLRLGLAPGDRIGLLGLNGAGKSTLVRALAGELEPLAGRIETSRGLSIGYFAQHQLEQLDTESSPLEHLQRLSHETPEQRLRDFLGGFDFRGDMATDPVAPLSGGEKARLVLAMLAWQAPNLLLLDEPTNHLDLEMRHALTVALQDFEGAVVTVSHDRHLLVSTVDEYWLVADGSVARFDGDLADYRRLVQSAPAAASESNRPGHPGRARRRQEAARRARLKPLQNRVDRLTREIDTIHTELREVEQQLADPGLYEGDQGDRLKALLQRQQRLSEQHDHLENQWLEAEQALESMLNAD